MEQGPGPVNGHTGQEPQDQDQDQGPEGPVCFLISVSLLLQQPGSQDPGGQVKAQKKEEEIEQVGFHHPQRKDAEAGKYNGQIALGPVALFKEIEGQRDQEPDIAVDVTGQELGLAAGSQGKDQSADKGRQGG